MTVFPPDNRRVVKPFDLDFDRFPLPAVTAIDTTVNLNPDPNGIPDLEAAYGSGVVISPNYVLSAAHNFYRRDLKKNQDEIRVSNSRNQLRLNSRLIGHPNDTDDLDINVITDDNDVNFGIFYPTNWKETGNVEDDIAFVKTVNNALISPSPFVGLIAFVDPKSAQDYTIQTAGYPIDNVSYAT